MTPVHVNNLSDVPETFTPEDKVYAAGVLESGLEGISCLAENGVRVSRWLRRSIKLPDYKSDAEYLLRQSVAEEGRITRTAKV